MKIIQTIKEQLALQKKKYMKEVSDKENNSQQKSALKLLAGFFAFMLVFTLLSRTADSMTVAVVETDSLKQGNIKHEIKTSGEILSESGQSLPVAEGLLIEKVHAVKGQSVKAGEELVSFEKASSELLLGKLLNELAELNLKRENAADTGDLSLITAKQNLDNAEQDYNRARTKAKDTIRLAEEAYQTAITDYDKLYAEYDYKGYIDKRWKLWIEEPILKEDEITSLYPNFADEENEAAWKVKVQDARSAMKAARQKIIDAEQVVDKELKADETAVLGSDREINSARLAYKEALKKDSEANSQASVDNQGYALEIKEKESDIKILQALKKNGWQLKAPTDGVLLSVKGEAGAKTSKGEMAALSKSAEGFKLIITVTKKQMDWIKQGDKVNVNLIESGRKTDVSAIVTSVAPAKKSGEYDLTIELPKGEYLVGDFATVSYSQQSEQYYSCLPIGALRSDSSGVDFVLIAEEKDSVLGSVAVAKRVDIEIKDRDDKTMEVVSSLLLEDKVIISSNKAIEKNDRVKTE